MRPQLPLDVHEQDDERRLSEHDSQTIAAMQPQLQQLMWTEDVQATVWTSAHALMSKSCPPNQGYAPAPASAVVQPRDEGQRDEVRLVRVAESSKFRVIADHKVIHAAREGSRAQLSVSDVLDPSQVGPKASSSQARPASMRETEWQRWMDPRAKESTDLPPAAAAAAAMGVPG